VPADAPQVADAPNTVVTINANGTTYTHSAYALGIGGETTELTPARTALLKFVNSMGDLAAVAGAAHVGTDAVDDQSPHEEQQATLEVAHLSQRGQRIGCQGSWSPDQAVTEPPAGV
ncbi:hypothetical protein, partial [Undibacterium luofuense]|uniref:hypothetical protein n=1 Tax=Undibacterium luofuense TaxID=2828733 RepID=UPI0030EE507D